MRTVYLYGSLAEKYGSACNLEVRSVGEAVKALQANFPGFAEDIVKGSFEIICGDLNDKPNCLKLTAPECAMFFKHGDFHIVPAIEGDKSKVWGYVIAVVGVILMVVGYIYGGPAGGAPGSKLAAYGFSVGMALAASGLSMILSPTPKTPDYGLREAAEDRPSFLMDGAVNCVEQGGSVPLIYGDILTGSVVTSGCLDVEEYQ